MVINSMIIFIPICCIFYNIRVNGRGSRGGSEAQRAERPGAKPLTAGGREDKGGFTGTVGSNTKQTSAQSS